MVLASIASTGRNQNYLKSVYSASASQHVRQLENEVNNYDIYKENTYAAPNDTYVVKFRNNEGDILATYNGNGQLIKSVEKFNHVRIPQPVLETLQKNFKGWTLHEAGYRVAYLKNKKAKKIYMLQLMKNQHKMNLKIDCLGNLLNKKNRMLS